GISQPGVPGRAFSRCTGLAATDEVTGAVEGLLPLVDPPHALRTTATMVAPMTRTGGRGVRASRSARPINAVHAFDQQHARSSSDLPYLRLREESTALTRRMVWCREDPGGERDATGDHR